MEAVAHQLKTTPIRIKGWAKTSLKDTVLHLRGKTKDILRRVQHMIEYLLMGKRRKWISKITSRQHRWTKMSLKTQIPTCNISSSLWWPLQAEKCSSLLRAMSKCQSIWRTTWLCVAYKLKETTANFLWTLKAKFLTWTVNSSEQQIQTSWKNCKMRMVTSNSKTCKI